LEEEERARGSNVGGQAVIEGVMMRSPQGAAVAVRSPGGDIVARRLETPLIGDRGDLWKRPVFRGAATLIDTLRLGLAGLNWSAEIVEESEGKSSSGVSGFLSTAFAVVLAVVLFAWLPLQAAMWTLGESSQIAIHLLAGAYRVAAFFGYIAAISLMPDIRRLFAYHGAEHQTIHAFERSLSSEGGDDPEELAEAAAAESPLHQRCGTSFLLLVMLATILFYALLDTGVVLAFGHAPGAAVRILYHLPLIPLVLGLSYEALKLADRHLETSALARAVTAPGLLLQRLTTRRADREMVEVAIASLQLSLGQEALPGVRIAGTADDGSRRGSDDG
jgi:uncharacterized protein YqhQ